MTIGITCAFIFVADIRWTLPIILGVTAYTLINFFQLVRLMIYKNYAADKISALIFYVFVMYSVIVIYAIVFRYFGVIDSATLKLDHDVVTCIYFSIVTWTTLGYGDFRPSPPIRLVAASEALMGYLMMAIFIAGVVATFAGPDATGDVDKPPPNDGNHMVE